MKVQQIIRALSLFGDWCGQQSNINSAVFEQAKAQNPWFTIDNQKFAFQTWANTLTEQNLNQWLSEYSIKRPLSPKSILLVCAGNLPLVALHDLLCILVSGNKAILKLSKDDSILMKAAIDSLKNIDNSFVPMIEIIDGITQVKNYDAVIATGSNNTNRYFEAYFSKLPSILRKHRNSVAVIHPQESIDNRTALGNDIFRYFGMGCRNVSKIYIPKNYDLANFFEVLEGWKDITFHNGYANNYQYHKAIWLMDKEVFFDNGFVMLKEQSSNSSPLSCVYFEYYSDYEAVFKKIEAERDQIQCIVSSRPGDVAFGKSQQPSLSSYADNVDTLAFLLNL